MAMDGGEGLQKGGNLPVVQLCQGEEIILQFLPLRRLSQIMESQGNLHIFQVRNEIMEGPYVVIKVFSLFLGGIFFQMAFLCLLPDEGTDLLHFPFHFLILSKMAVLFQQVLQIPVLIIGPCQPSRSR